MGWESMKRVFVGLVAFGGFLWFCQAVAGAGTVDEAMRKLDAKDAAGAYALLKPEEEQRAGDPDFDYVLGLASIDAGHATEAVAALERVLAVRPGHLQARAELGRAYIALNEPEAARRELATVEERNDVPADVRQAIRRYVDALDTGLSGGGTQISGNATFRTGYDSNVNNSTSDSRILIPAFSGLGYASLNPSATAQDDAFGEASGSMSLSQGLSIDRRFIADISASYRGNASEAQFNQAIAGFNFGIAQATPDSGNFALSAQTQAYWVDGKPYRYALGGLGQWTLTTRGRTDLGLYLQYAYLSYPNNSTQNANRYTAGGTIGQQFGGRFSPYLYAGIYGGLEETTDSAFDTLSYWLSGARVGAQVRLTERLSAHAGAAVETNDYKKEEPLFFKKRSTVRTDLVAGTSYALGGGVSLGAEVAYTRADSNIVLYKYDRTVGSFSISFDF
jgi:hypothetical protein